MGPGAYPSCLRERGLLPSILITAALIFSLFTWSIIQGLPVPKLVSIYFNFFVCGIIEMIASLHVIVPHLPSECDKKYWNYLILKTHVPFDRKAVRIVRCQGGMSKRKRRVPICHSVKVKLRDISVLHWKRNCFKQQHFDPFQPLFDLVASDPLTWVAFISAQHRDHLLVGCESASCWGWDWQLMLLGHVCPGLKTKTEQMLWQWAFIISSHFNPLCNV